jgi:putative ABC transport system permease protein
MRLYSRLKSSFRNLIHRPRVEASLEVEDPLEEELRAYVDMIADERVAAGMSAAEARRSVLAEFGGVEPVKQEVRDHRAGVWSELFWQDVRFGLRQLLRNRGFTIAAIATLALGIGANTAIFSVVNTVLLKPLAYPDADRMVHFFIGPPDHKFAQVNIPEVIVLQRQTSLFSEVVAYDLTGPGFNLTGDHPEQLHGLHVTQGYFHFFGARAILGRTFTLEEDSPHGGKVVMLSYGLWQRKFAGDPSILGKSLSLGNDPYTIVGVLDKQFQSDSAADIWVPFQFDPASNDMTHDFQASGLLSPNITQAQADAQMTSVTAQFRRAYPKSNDELGMVPLSDAIIGDARQSLVVMLGAVSLVLLIACANVANLLLVRATGRRREFAIRSALGASRGRIIRQLLVESVLISIAGGVLGLGLGFIGVRALLAISPAGLPRIGEDGSGIGIDWRVLAFTLTISLATGILFGLIPAFTASRSDMNTVLKKSGNGTGTGFRQGKTRSLLVISEVSLALVLLIGSALLIRTLIALHNVDPGFGSHNVLTMEMSLNGDRFQKTSGIAQLSQNGRDRLNALPGVEVAAAGYWLPHQTDDSQPFQIIGRPVDKDHRYSSHWMSISPGYLNVFKIPLLRGRDVLETDSAAAPGVALINQAMARRYWPDEDPIGQQVVVSNPGPAWHGEPTREIVGIVSDTHNAGLGSPSVPLLIIPIAQATDGYTAAYSNVQPLLWLVRTRSDPRLSIPAITEQLRIASDGFPVAHIRTMDEVMGRSTARQSFNMLLLTIFGAVALLLAAIGIYGLMAYSVVQRTQEMGIRIALGADRSVIRNFVVRQGMTLAAVGIGGGMAASFGFTRFLSSFLFGVKPWDPAVFVSAALILTAIALLAVWLPATRAAKVDPMQALRAE